MILFWIFAEGFSPGQVFRFVDQRTLEQGTPSVSSLIRTRGSDNSEDKMQNRKLAASSYLLLKSGGRAVTTIRDTGPTSIGKIHLPLHFQPRKGKRQPECEKRHAVVVVRRWMKGIPSAKNN